MRVLIFGGGGMLGQALAKTFADMDVLTPSSRAVDLADGDAVREAVFRTRPDLIINAAAYNRIDVAEHAEGYSRAMAINGHAPQALARVAVLTRTPLVHYSADAVFAHNTPSGYIESAAPGPVMRMSVWARSKLIGEQHIARESERHYIVRTSRLFGAPGSSLAGKKSFVDEVLTRANEALFVPALDEEVAALAYAPDVARATRRLWEDGAPWGKYHLVNEGTATWYELAREAIARSGAGAIVKAAARSALPQAALAPRYSVLINTKRPKLRHWKEALKAYLSK